MGIALRSVNRLRSVSPFAIAAVCIAFGASAVQALPVARLRNVKPTIQIRTSRASAFSAVRPRQALNFGDTLRTDKNGKAEVLFTNGTRVAMNGGSQIQIVAPETRSSPLVIRVVGALSEVFVRPRGNTQIRTAAAIAAARGTAFLVRLPDENSAVVTVTEDQVDFFNESGRVLVSAGQQSTAAVGSAPTPPVAVDASGELAWTAQIAGLPVEYETTLNAPDAAALLLAADDAAKNPDDAATLIRLGEARRLNGDAAGAAEAYERALQFDAASTPARVGLALSHLSLDDTQRTRAALQPIVSTAEAQTIAGLMLLQRGEDREALDQLQSAANRNPNLYQAQSLLALALLSQNRLAESRQAATRAVAIEPRSSQAQGTLAMALFFSGREFTDDATRAANRAVAANPLSPFALLVQGRVSLLNREPDEAAAAFAQAAALSPRLEIAQREWGAALLRQDKLESAEKAYRRALEIEPNSAEAQSGLGLVKLRQGRYVEARTAQERALEIDPNNATALANYAAVLIEEGNLDEARRRIEAGLITAPDRGVLYIRLSEASLFAQRPQEALEAARKAVGLLPDSALARYQLGRVFLELERYTQAVQEFRKALLIERDFPEARYALGYARELSESGRDPSRPAATAGAGALNSAARALDIQNLQTPGAEDRFQALTQDPTVIRTATRSFGDTEIKLSIGQNGSLDATISHSQLGDGQRRVIGATADRQSFDEINDRDNSDLTTDRYGLIFGQKAKNNPSSFFAIAQYEKIEEGLNKGDQLAIGASARAEATKPRVIVGGNWQTRDDSRTRALIQYVAPKGDSINPLFGDEQDDEVDSLNIELRHDRRFGRKHHVSAGLFGGKREREANLFLAGFPPLFPDFRSRTNTDLSVFGGYVRDEYRASRKLWLIGELKAQRVKSETSFQFLEPIVGPVVSSQINRTEILPTFIAEYHPNLNTGIRFRIRRVLGGIRDFELLSPKDTFLSPLNDLPLVGYGGTGTSVELEGDHTFRNGSFVRVGVFQQTARNAVEPTADGSGAVLPRTRVRGVRAGYEGQFGRDLSFFLGARYNRARDRELSQDIANVPKWAGEAGLQYLNPAGWFVQPSFYYQGSRVRTDRSSADSFGVLNLRAGKRFGLRGVVFVEVRNLTDEEYDILEVEQTGRQYRLGVIGRF